MHFYTSVILLIISAILYVHWLFKKAHTFFDKNDIPYVKPTWLVGNMGEVITLRKATAVVYRELYKKLEPYKFAGVFNLHTPTIMIRDPEMIKQILIKDFSHFRDRANPVNSDVEPLGNHLLSMTGDEWKNYRIKLISAFTTGKMKIMLPLMKECGDKLALRMETLTNETIEIKELCYRYTTDIIGTCAFGLEIHSLDDAQSQFRIMGQRVLKFRYRTLIRSLYPNIPEIMVKLFKLKVADKKLEDFFISVFDNIIKYREKNNITRNDFIDLLLALKNEGKSEYHDNNGNSDSNTSPFHFREKPSKSNIKITPSIMAAQSFLFFAAGFEPSAISLSFLILELALNKEIQNKVRKEIKTLLDGNDGQLTYEMMKQMPYVDMVIAETLRKYPPGGLLFRQCTDNYTLPNTKIVIPEKMPIVIPLYAIHMDPKYYERPEEFYPEHFTEEAKSKRPHYTYLPFGDGPRICIAERFAIMQIKVGLISLIQNFSYDISPKMKLPVEYFPSSGTRTDGIWLNCEKI